MSTWPQQSTISAAEIAATLGLPEPTDEQCAVIEAAPLPALIVAGAGSGKTETMAARVVWLVANGHVRREEILGLTFTRKAASELAERIIQRLDRLTRQVTGHTPTIDDLLLRPRVSTYNAFADALAREHAARIGRDPEAVLLSESAAWLLARRLVLASTDAELARRDLTVNTLTERVLALAGAVLDHRADLGEATAFTAGLAAELHEVTDSERRPGNTEKAQQALADFGIVARLAEQYARAKAERGVFDYADQVAGALQVIETSPDVTAEVRAQYRVVLLDEYQDTSVLQTRLLSALFAEQAVMAVGDPNQAIYSWRGASADNLAAFAEAFSPQGRAQRFDLSISWRNDRQILKAAGALLADRRDQPRLRVPELRASPRAGEGRVRCLYPETIEEEAAGVAEWFAQVRAARGASEGAEHTGAILFRTKAHMHRFAEALAERGIPHRVLGLGGLLRAPEVVDVISALRVIDDPAAGSALIRLLAGPRFAIGVADLEALHALARTLAERDEGLSRLDDEVLARIRARKGPDETASIVEALEFLRRIDPGYRLLEGFTDAGRARLREAAEMFARLRLAAHAPIPELLRQIESELRLDIELAANEARGPARAATAQLRALGEEVRAFLAVSERDSIGALLSWLDHAESTDELRPRPEPPEPGVVQLLTIHGAKGLEWDATAVVRLVEGELPTGPRSVQGWLRLGELPYRFRGDRAALPEFGWDRSEALTRKTVETAISVFQQGERDYREAEERRLAYVAVTRSRSELLLSGSWWATQTKARRPSPYLESIIDRLGLEPVAASAFDENPRAGAGQALHWPQDPLGGRRAVVESAASLVRAVAEAAPTPELSLLLAERAERRAGSGVQAPTRIPASRFKDYVADFAGTAAQIARPMPERPYPQTALGTLFHSWAEQHYGLSGARSLDDALWQSDDEDISDAAATTGDEAELARLQEIFLGSEWAMRAPIAVESEIHLPLSDPHSGERHIVICKLDAVFAREGGGVEIVDWKTGRPPANPLETEERMLQLALYRLAYHRRHGVPLDEIEVALYYVAHDLVIRDENAYSEAELLQRWSAARAAR